LRLYCGTILLFTFAAAPKALGDDVVQIVEEIKASQKQGAVAANTEFPERGFISDPDGFTNVRLGPGTKHPVVAVIRLGEPFDFRRDESNWWRVKTSGGTIGFVHSSRISRPGQSNANWVVADSSSRRLSSGELESLTADQLWRARTEIFARRGLVFRTARGRRLAESLGDQYNPSITDQRAIADALNPIERHNHHLDPGCRERCRQPVALKR
jgi:uncharacterized protein YgiM (DUF1202 family)